MLAKVNPPIRGRADVDAMWEGIADGSIDTVGTDHVPRKRSTKAGKGIWASSNGFPGRGDDAADHARTRAITAAASRRSASPRCCRANAARIYRHASKGALAVGYDADLAVVDPELERTVDPATLESFADYSPYEGMTLKGWPVVTLRARPQGHGRRRDVARRRAEAAERPLSLPRVLDSLVDEGTST